MLSDVEIEAKKALLKANEVLAEALKASSKAITLFNTILAGAEDAEDLIELMKNVNNVSGGDNKGKGKEVEEGEKEKPKRIKKPIDPNAPKRPLSAYLEYQNAVRAAFRTEDPAIPYADTLRKISAAWTALPDSDKKPFIDITAAKLAQYELERDAYKLAHPGEYTGPTEGSEDVEMADAETPAKKKVKKVATPAVVAAAAPAVVVAEPVVAKKEKKEKKEKKVVEAAPAVVVPVVAAPKVKARKSAVETPAKVPVPAPAPVETDSSEDEEDSASSEEDSDDDSSDEEEEPVAPVVVAPVVNGSSKKRKEAVKEVETPKSKSKKSKTT